jgi:hypothetical protein
MLALEASQDSEHVAHLLLHPREKVWGVDGYDVKGGNWLKMYLRIG